MKKAERSQAVQTRTWQMSFNDLMTVLLTFFILLVSMSNIRMDMAQDVSSSAVKSFGPGAGDDGRASLVREMSSVEGIDVHQVEGGIAIVLSESLVYPSGSADIIHTDLLGRLGRKIRMTGGSVRVEGHTDSIPVSGSVFASNWELSAQRAVNVVKFLAGECGIDPGSLSAAGYADSRPVAPNNTAEGRSLNRRVNIIISWQ
jgi:chemotaxis protein MotB